MSPLLPPELQREIFETAIQLNHGDALVKLNLNLVAHHVHFWVDHAFYRVVQIFRSNSADKFLALVDSKPADFFANAVKVLIVGASVLERQTARILHACRGIESLAFWWMRYGSSPVLVGQLPLLRRLSVRSARTRNLSQTVTDHRLLSTHLSTLTHLDLAHAIHLRKVSDFRGILQGFHSLTHVALPSWYDHARLVVESCPALQVLVILVHSAADINDDIVELYSFDYRIVAATMEDSVNADWIAPYLGRGDHWISAERVIAERAATRTEQALGS
ncbi:hypothetical protein C8R46DRAFT_421327 [Mycena filopes]|nr:hypothetical protein C8R46DRAFT_421327 [Mycena filopes]